MCKNLSGEDHAHPKVRRHTLRTKKNEESTEETKVGTTKEASAGRVAKSRTRLARGKESGKSERLYARGGAHDGRSRHGES